jgi:aryl-alcohol dehydrogenase-like predicted oxidoreductase
LMEALWASNRLGIARFDCLQPRYNLINRAEFELDLAEVCQVYGVGVIPYSPIAGGFLSGKYSQERTEVDSKRNVSRYYNERSWKILEAVRQVASQANASVSQVALAWVLRQPVITSPIIGPRNVEQLEDNLGALPLQLTQDQLEILDQVSAWK